MYNIIIHAIGSNTSRSLLDICSLGRTTPPWNSATAVRRRLCSDLYCSHVYIFSGNGPSAGITQNNGGITKTLIFFHGA